MYEQHSFIPFSRRSLSAALPLIVFSLHFSVAHGNFSALGTLRNGDRCLQVATNGSSTHLLFLASCYEIELTQWHLHRDSGQLSTASKLCLGVVLQPSGKPQLMLQTCLRDAAKVQRWHRWYTQLVHAATRLCLDNPLQDRLDLSSCRAQAVSQSFQFALEMEAQRV